MNAKMTCSPAVHILCLTVAYILGISISNCVCAMYSRHKVNTMLAMVILPSTEKNHGRLYNILTYIMRYAAAMPIRVHAKYTDKLKQRATSTPTNECDNTKPASSNAVPSATCTRIMNVRNLMETPRNREILVRFIREIFFYCRNLATVCKRLVSVA